MISGIVNARREAVVQIRVRGPSGIVVTRDAVIDTGFSASLTLPATVIAAIGLQRQSSSRATLADGTVVQLDLYAAEVEWDGVWRSILISAVGGEVLIGMGILVGYELRITVVSGGLVAITTVP
jgi:clan AA aspartic protease